MTSHKDHRLDQLGIVSQDEADELQRELDIRFDRFTYRDRKVWNRQNSYLDAYAHTRTVSDSADVAGVTVSTAQAWKYLDTLGFTRRLEIADLRFSDNLQVLALERVREPDAPASLLIALLRAHIPEKYSANGHLCDTSKTDELLFHYRQDAQRELAAGHPTLRAIANGTYQPSHSNLSPSAPSARSVVNPPPPNRHTGEEPAPYSIRGRYPEKAQPDSRESDQEISSSHEAPTGLPHDDYPPLDEEDFAHFDLSPSAPAAPSAVNRPTPPNRHTGEEPAPYSIRGRYPEKAHPDSRESDDEISSSHEAPTGLPHDDIPPVDPDEVAFSNLSPAGGEIQRGGSPSAPNRRPIASLYQTARPHPNNDHNTFKVKRF